MKIATAINVHANPDMLRDTIDSVRVWATKNVLVIVDKASWTQFRHFTHPDTQVICGHYHAARKSPYKNFAKSLTEMYGHWPDMDWYNYIEFDVLYLNSNFKYDLDKHDPNKVGVLGFNVQDKHDSTDNWMAREILNKPDLKCYKVLGAVMFFPNHCVRDLIQCGFFDELQKRTADFKGEFFPNFQDYAVEEIIFPSAASSLGYVRNLSVHNGGGDYYRVRFGQTISQHEILPSTSLIHPIKDPNSPIHIHYRNTRKLFL